MSVSGPVRFAASTGVFAAAQVVVFLRASEWIGGWLRARVTR